MISRVPFGWQTTMADLALILFMVTAAGVHAQQKRPAAVETSASPSAQGAPLAVYRADDGAPPLGTWLAEQAPDQRQFLTIVSRYRPGGAATAADEALKLAQQAGTAGVSARIVLEPGTAREVFAMLAFDRPDDGVAQPLQSTVQD